MSFCVECRRDIAPGTGLRCNACKVEYQSARNLRRIARKTKAMVESDAAKATAEFGPVLLGSDSASAGNRAVEGVVGYMKINETRDLDKWFPGPQEVFCPQCRYQRPVHADCSGWCLYCFTLSLVSVAEEELDFESIEAWFSARCPPSVAFEDLCFGRSLRNMNNDQKEEMYGPIVATMESASSPGRRYEVRLLGEQYSCNCAGWAFRRTCKHADYCKQTQVGVVRDPVFEAIQAAVLESNVLTGISYAGLKRVAANIKKRLGSVMIEPGAAAPLPEGRVIILED